MKKSQRKRLIFDLYCLNCDLFFVLNYDLSDCMKTVIFFQPLIPCFFMFSRVILDKKKLL